MKSFIAAFLITLSLSAHASKSVTGEAGPVVESCTGGLKVATGQKGVGYSKLYADLASVCKDQIKLCEARTTGGLDNLNALSNKKADIGFAQLDTIKDMSPGNENIAALQAVIPMNYNYLHIVVSAAGYTSVGEKRAFGLMDGTKKITYMRKLSDLKSQRVVLVGSAQLLGRTLAQRYLKNYDMQFVDAQTIADGLAKVKNGEVAAMFAVSGVPNDSIDALNSNSGFTLIPFDEEVSAPYVMRKMNYKGLSVYNLKALAIQNVMITRPFGEAKAALVEQVRQCIVSSLGDLKDGEYEPAWNEMKADTQVDLPKFVAPGNQQFKQKRK